MTRKKAIAKVHMPDTMRNLELQVKLTGVRELRLRIFLGALLLKCAARILGCGIHIEQELKK